jgi:hypothetical protein
MAKKKTTIEEKQNERKLREYLEREKTRSIACANNSEIVGTQSGSLSNPDETTLTKSKRYKNKFTPSTLSGAKKGAINNK